MDRQRIPQSGTGAVSRWGWVAGGRKCRYFPTVSDKMAALWSKVTTYCGQMVVNSDKSVESVAICSHVSLFRLFRATRAPPWTRRTREQKTRDQEPDGAQETRKPTSSSRSPGLPLSRNADRRSEAGPSQLPPRKGRRSSSFEPTGSRQPSSRPS